MVICNIRERVVSLGCSHALCASRLRLRSEKIMWPQKKKKSDFQRIERLCFCCYIIRKAHNSDRKWTVLWGCLGTRPDTSKNPEGVWRVALLPSRAQQGASQHLSHLKREVSPTKFSGDTQWSLYDLHFSYWRPMLNEALRKTSSLPLRKSSLRQ